jgi:tRNA (guanine26-N2/guanine27-N2)-dimethyltransferase
MDTIIEGGAKLRVSLGKISKKLDVFYNPLMKLNRDVSVALLQVLGDKDLQIALPLSGSGVRGVRFLVELDNIKSIGFNDNSETAVDLIKQNIELNEDKLNCDDIEVSCLDSDDFLLGSKGFDYIDIDPFGNPSPFLDSAVKRISRRGVLAVTATDTSALCGVYPKVCKRKYWATPLRNELMHEMGLRILIRKVQLIGAQYEKALVPVYSYSWNHYMRVFFKCKKGGKKVDDLLKLHGAFENIGPMWLGKLYDPKLVKKIDAKLGHELTGLIANEEDVLGFYDLHAIAKRVKLKGNPVMLELMEKLKKKGYVASRTQFSRYGIKTDMPLDKFMKLIKIF